jgi:hypothetical protein
VKILPDHGPARAAVIVIVVLVALVALFFAFEGINHLLPTNY